MDYKPETEINHSAYSWSARLFSILEKMLNINIRMHHDKGQLAQGEIFLFNHFARFETFIPQSLIYRETGVYCRSVASSEFFSGDDIFSNYLLSVGAVPHNYPRLIPYLAGEILRGRKIIIFPEGGMVKDRRVVDRRGGYSIYSRIAKERRKHHTGAALLSLTLDIYKKAILQAHVRGDHAKLERWSAELKMDNVESLLTAALRPSTIIPANITFYPMRVGDNLLKRSVELFNKGISRRLSEELLIEGNILFKHTDMDIHLGDPIHTDQFWGWLDRQLIAQAAFHFDGIDDILEPNSSRRLIGGVRAKRIRRKALALRDKYMHIMYSQITVNLSHLASKIIFKLLDQGQTRIDYDSFHRMLYLAVKGVQKEAEIILHRSLKNPEAYGNLTGGRCKGLDQFIKTASSLGLIEQENHQYHFLPKLRDEHAFDDIRTENLVAVYANEVAPLSRITTIIKEAIDNSNKLTDQQLALLHFDDEIASYNWDKAYFSKPRHQALNEKETATQSGEPFLFLPDNHKQLGVVLAHGFLASPAEIRPFGERLAALGYPVIGSRLKGHGTSPWDLRKRSWEDWLASVEHAYKVMSGITEKVCIAGFSTGGALGLQLASTQPDQLAGIIALGVPIKFRNKNMSFVVPVMHGANKLVKWVSSYEGVMPFRPNQSEHPDINYYSMPLHSLFELGQMASAVESNLKNIHCPTYLIQADEDIVVDPRSAQIIYDKISSEDKELVMIASSHHGILHDDTGGTQDQVISFLSRLDKKE